MWGTELWDQFEGVSYHTSKGIDFLDKYGSFIKERSAIEADYASKLRRLVKNHQYKKKDESDTQFTYVQAFVQMLSEISDLAGQHEMISENLGKELLDNIGNLIKALKEERKKYLTEGQKLHNNLNASYLQLDKSKKYYERAFKEAEKAHEHFEKVDADLNLSRAEVEKARQVSQSKTQLADNLKSEYATNLQKTNELQRIHFQDSMPNVFNQLQEMEKRRILSTQNFIYQGAKIHLDVFPIIEKCLQGIISASELVDANKDCDFVVERYKSGMEPPEDLPFEDLSNPSADQNNGTNVQTSHSLNYSNSITGKDTMKGTMVYAKLKKRAGFFNIFGGNKANFDEFKEEIYADLPPMQRRKRLQEKFNNIQDQLNQENNVREGLMKMKQAYLDNSKLGDPATVDSQLNENASKLKKLQLEAEKYEKYLSELNSAKPPNSGGSRLNGSQQTGNQTNRNSISEESLSRSASDSSVSHPQQQQQQQSAATKNGALNGLNNKTIFKQMNSTSHNNLNTFKSTLNGQLNGNSANSSGASSNTGSSNYEQDHSPDIGGKINLSNVDFIDGDQEIEEEFEIDLISYGKAKALYAFEPESEGAIKMTDKELFDVVELDQGDGWTRVRRANLEEGFVPTSYLEIRLND